MKTALITGITGFIGSHLALALLKDNWQVHAIIRTTSDTTVINKKDINKIIFHLYDNTDDDSLALKNIIHEVQPNVVFHLASLFLSDHKSQDIAPIITSNITFATQLIDAMVKNNIYNFINTGTSWQHYHSNDYCPVNLYAASKQAFDDILLYYQEAKALKVINLKLFDTYGPDDPRKKIISLLNKLTLTGESLDMSAGEQLIDIVYIDDVVDAFLLAGNYLLKKNYKYLGTYAVSSKKTITLKNLITIYESIVNKKLHINWGKRSYRDREVMLPWNTGLLLPGWQAQITLKEGFKLIIRGEKQ